MRDTKSDNHDRPAAPNYTSACIVMFGVNLTWILVAIWAIWGLIVVMLLGAIINHMMTRIKAYTDARAAHDRAFPRAKARD